jgi:dipeptidyl aminopeptidase/acylaminoacyl peptidase
MSVFGAYDMAGNVKEWCWNETEIGRMILGGGWNEQSYMFSDRDARAPLDRRPDNGFRLVKRLDTPSLAAMERLERRTRDYTKEKPISDEAFAVARGLYNYDPVPLDARIDNVEETADWRKETVSIAAAYSGERLPAYLYLPKNARPPFQVVVYFPGGDATMMRSSRELRLLKMDFLIRSGRAVLYPVYKGTYERVSPNTGTNALRDLTIARIKDVRRSMDYLATRQDIDIDRVGYYGISLGAFLGIFSTALEPRFKATVFVGSGLTSIRYPAEMDPLNFLPRIKTPTLLVNGKDDFAFPLEASQRPLVQLLGAREKQLVSFDGGHILVRVNEVVRVILDWFDKHLGPVALSLG